MLVKYVQARVHSCADQPQEAVQVLFAASRTDSQLRFHFPPVFPLFLSRLLAKISPALLSLQQPFLGSLVCRDWTSLSATSPILVAFTSNHTEAPDYREFYSRILIFVFYFLFPFLLHKYFSLRMSRCRWTCMQTLSFLFALEWLCCKPCICFITFRGLSISSFNSRALHWCDR